ncbi:hypothetical protein [Clostridium sp. KNHs216]|uniref:hypothetical protein n=1 Tax=Clostridium sp. KNHs216 TaxID=1550235 RepID=UPI001150005C|nr:hypothetical protein [Clostridium sp. KNHs216]TQI66722.1 hypothetical protein LY85_1393 [Clostridium sp. KNHs216]
MGARYDNIAGVQHKVSKRYDNINGVWRPVSKRYNNIAGVWRQGYSGTIAQAHVNLDILHESYLREDGSGRLGLRSTFYDDDPSNYSMSIDFYFDEAISIARNGTAFQLLDMTATSSRATDGASIYVHAYNDAGTDYYLGYIYSSQTPYGLKNPVKSNYDVVAKRVNVLFQSKLYATSNFNAYYYVDFPSGALTIGGKVINSIELI